MDRLVDSSAKIDKRRRDRYFTVANLVILLTGGLLLTLGAFSPAPPQVDNILLNVGSSIIVIGIIFFFGKFLLFDPQSDMEDQLDRIELSLQSKASQSDLQDQLDRIELLLKTRASFFITREQRNARHPFDQFLGEGQDLYIGGVALRAVRSHLSVLEARLKAGAHLRFALLDPDSHDVQDIANEHHVSKDYISSDIHISIGELRQLQIFSAVQKSGSVEIRLLRREPTFSFILREPYGTDGVLYGDLRVFRLDSGFRPCWELKSADKPWFEIFIKTCESLWADSRPLPE